MAADRINVYPAYFMAPIELDDPAAVHSVGLSHLGEYLDVMYGGDFPRDQQARRLSAHLLESMALLSTDDSLSYEALEANPLSYISHKLRLVEPVVNNAKSIGRYVGEELTAREASSQPGDRPEINDFTYVLGIFDLSSFVVSDQLDLDHPRFHLQGLIECAQGVVPADHEMTGAKLQENQAALERLLPLLKRDHRRKLINLRRQGEKIVANAEDYIQRAVPVLEAYLDDAE
jgi:hypothetical protein